MSLKSDFSESNLTEISESASDISPLCSQLLSFSVLISTASLLSTKVLTESSSVVLLLTKKLTYCLFFCSVFTDFLLSF